MRLSTLENALCAWKRIMYVKFGNVETEAWFIDSFEEWRKAKNLSGFILLGHSFGGYVAAKYALKVICFGLVVGILRII